MIFRLGGQGALRMGEIVFGACAVEIMRHEPCVQCLYR